MLFINTLQQELVLWVCMLIWSASTHTEFLAVKEQYVLMEIQWHNCVAYNTIVPAVLLHYC